jgi:hypothetical protein
MCFDNMLQCCAEKRDGLNRFTQIDLETFEYHLNSTKSLMKKHRYNRETRAKLFKIFS